MNIKNDISYEIFSFSFFYKSSASVCKYLLKYFHTCLSLLRQHEYRESMSFRPSHDEKKLVVCVRTDTWRRKSKIFLKKIICKLPKNKHCVRLCVVIFTVEIINNLRAFAFIFFFSLISEVRFGYWCGWWSILKFMTGFLGVVFFFFLHNFYLHFMAFIYIEIEIEIHLSINL